MNDDTRVLQALHGLEPGPWPDPWSHQRPSSGPASVSPPLPLPGASSRGGCRAGHTGSPGVFEQARAGTAYRASVSALPGLGLTGADLLFELMLEDLSRAPPAAAPADPPPGPQAAARGCAWTCTGTGTGTGTCPDQACAPATRRVVQVSGTPEDLRALEDLVFDGVSVNATLLVSRQQYLAAAEAYMRGLERRLAARLVPRVACLATLSAAGAQRRLGIAVALLAYRAHRELLASERWLRLAAAGARPQRLVWAGCSGNSGNGGDGVGAGSEGCRTAGASGLAGV